MDPSIYMPGATKTINDVPIEVRQEIWSLVLTPEYGQPIGIVSPDTRTSKDRITPRTPNLGALLLVNKAMYAEARPVFYKSNTFAIGNRTPTSHYEPNAHAFHAFIKRVPKIEVERITNICLHVEFCQLGPYGFLIRMINDSRDKKADLLSICRAVVTHLKSVRIIDIDILPSRILAVDNSHLYSWSHLYAQNIYAGNNHRRSPHFKFLVEAVKILCSCEHLEAINFLTRPKYNMERIIELISESSTVLKKKQVQGVFRTVDKEHSGDTYGPMDLMLG